MAVSATSSSGMLCSSSPAAPTIMMRISAVFTMRTIFALSMRVGELPGERRQQEEGQDEQPARNRAERRLLLRVAVDAVDDEHHHRGAEQIVVERAEELGDEDRPGIAACEAGGGSSASACGQPIRPRPRIHLPRL